MRGMSLYECTEYPCIHVVVDYSRKRMAVFLEDSEGEVLWIPVDRLLEAAERVRELLESGFSEASGKEVDELAYSYLEAEPE